jgi:hypothetical protein
VLPPVAAEPPAPLCLPQQAGCCLPRQAALRAAYVSVRSLQNAGHQPVGSQALHLQLVQQLLRPVPPVVALDGYCRCSAALLHGSLRRLQQACHIYA